MPPLFCKKKKKISTTHLQSITKHLSLKGKGLLPHSPVLICFGTGGFVQCLIPGGQKKNCCCFQVGPAFNKSVERTQNHSPLTKSRVPVTFPSDNSSNRGGPQCWHRKKSKMTFNYAIKIKCTFDTTKTHINNYILAYFKVQKVESGAQRSENYSILR